ncbi:MAG: NAD(+)/NADH kinase [Bacteroidales bacterium]|nr:NAD(+)/NADH kinase [Bacteroidales bacterium]
MIKNIAIFGYDNGRPVADYVRRIIGVLREEGAGILISNKLEGLIDPESRDHIKLFSDIENSPVVPDLLLSVGGDGTFLETASKVAGRNIPVAGMNAGRLGFLANIHDDPESALKNILHGRYTITERYMLRLTEPAGLMGDNALALNDITVQKGDLNMITVKVYVDDLYLNTYWSDGLIISTATGSTAYNLSTGGPILSPGDDSIVISPLSPHNLTVRPIVLPGNSTLSLVVEGRSNDYLVTCDYRSARLPFETGLIINQPEYTISTVNPEGHDFFSTLRTKLMWGADPRN